MKRIFVILMMTSIFLGCEEPSKDPDSGYEQLAYLEGGFLEGYFLDTTAINEDMPYQIEDTLGPFVYRIDRDYAFTSGRLKRLTEKAESLFPPLDTIAASYGFHATEIPEDESMWWCRTFDGVRIPYAITWSAVEYYLSLLSYYEDGLFEEAETITMASASFVYEAGIDFYPSFQLSGIDYQQVWVVSQRLQWDNHCGSLCALFFEVNRMVIFDYQTEQVIAVIGDGVPVVMVS